MHKTKTYYADLSDLIDELAQRFEGKKGLSGYAHAVYEGVGFEPLSYDDRALIDSQTVALDKKMKMKGFRGSYGKSPELRVIHCMADNDSARLIYPDGKIGKCENKSSLDCIGDIYHDILDEDRNLWYKEVIQSDICYECCIYPDCFNLVVCPEAGKCSTPKKEWKKPPII